MALAEIEGIFSEAEKDVEKTLSRLYRVNIKRRKNSKNVAHAKISSPCWQGVLANLGNRIKWPVVLHVEPRPLIPIYIGTAFISDKGFLSQDSQGLMRGFQILDGNNFLSTQHLWEQEAVPSTHYSVLCTEEGFPCKSPTLLYEEIWHNCGEPTWRLYCQGCGLFQPGFAIFSRHSLVHKMHFRTCCSWI